MDAEAKYAHLKELASSMPDFGQKGAPNLSGEVMTWLGRLHAILDKDPGSIDAMLVQAASNALGGALHDTNTATITAALYRALGKVELDLPVAAQGAFIPVGNAFDAVATASRVLSSAKLTVLFVDPYLGPSVLEKYAILARDGVSISLLASKDKTRPGLEMAAEAWVTQFGGNRPLTMRYAPAKALHDRLIIIDNVEVWDVSQSFEDLAVRSPATFSKTPLHMREEKMEAYRAIYDGAEAIIS